MSDRFDRDSTAARTREAARRHPFLVDALAAGVVNYSEAARHLIDRGDLPDADPEAAATALARYADDLSTDRRGRSARVRMATGVEVADAAGADGDATDGTGVPDPADSPDRTDATDATDAGPPRLAVGPATLTDDGDRTALLATGDVDPTSLGAVLSALRVAGIDPAAAGAAGDALVVVVDRRAGTDALRVVEDALDRVPAVRDG